LIVKINMNFVLNFHYTDNKRITGGLKVISLPDLKQKTEEVLRENGLAVLASIHEDVPHQTLVAVAGTEDLRFLLFATPVYTRKYENIQNNPFISLHVDNRKNTELDFINCTALTVRGKAEIIPDKDLAKYRKIYLQRHPYLESFLLAPSAQLVLVKVHTYTVVSSFQKVEEWSPKK